MGNKKSKQTQEDNTVYPMEKTDEEWKKILTPEQFRVCRQKGTERAFTGEFHDNHDEGIYSCVACKKSLFTSKEKFDSGTGWPSYYAPIDKTALKEHVDVSISFIPRTEVVCGNCGSHLGHDGPKPTGLRYCINSVSLAFEKKG